MPSDVDDDRSSRKREKANENEDEDEEGDYEETENDEACKRNGEVLIGHISQAETLAPDLVGQVDEGVSMHPFGTMSPAPSGILRSRSGQSSRSSSHIRAGSVSPSPQPSKAHSPVSSKIFPSLAVGPSDHKPGRAAAESPRRQLLSLEAAFEERQASYRSMTSGRTNLSAGSPTSMQNRFSYRRCQSLDKVDKLEDKRIASNFQFKEVLKKEMTRLSTALRRDVRDEMRACARQWATGSAEPGLGSTGVFKTATDGGGGGPPSAVVKHHSSARPRNPDGQDGGMSFLDRHRKLGIAKEIESRKASDASRKEYARKSTGSVHGKSWDNLEELVNLGRTTASRGSNISVFDVPTTSWKNTARNSFVSFRRTRTGGKLGTENSPPSPSSPMPLSPKSPKTLKRVGTDQLLDSVLGTESQATLDFTPTTVISTMPPLPSEPPPTMPATSSDTPSEHPGAASPTHTTSGSSLAEGRPTFVSGSVLEIGWRRLQESDRPDTPSNTLPNMPAIYSESECPSNLDASRRRLGNSKPPRHSTSMAPSASIGFFPGRDRVAAAGKHAVRSLATDRLDEIEYSRWRRWQMAFDSFANRLLKDPRFDYFIGLLILINGILMGVQVEVATNQGTSVENSDGFRIVGVLFCICFTGEMAVRLYVHRWSFFTSLDWRWNVLDFSIVILQIIEEIMNEIANATNDQNSTSSSFVFLRVLRGLRLVRIVRIVRVMHLLKELRSMISSVVGTLRSLLWTVVLLLLIMYMGAVYLSQLILDHGLSHPEDVEPGTQLYEHYGSLSKSTLTLFMSITGGIDWRDAVDPLKDEISPHLSWLFASFVAFMLFSMLNVITGIFVESALNNSKEESDVDMVNYLHSVFVGPAKQTDGKITWEEFEEKLDEPKMMSYFKSINLDPSEARFLFELLDIEGANSIDAEDFVMGCLRLRGPAQAIDLASLMSETRRLRIFIHEHWQDLEEQLSRDQLTHIDSDSSSMSPSGSKLSGTSVDRFEIGGMQNSQKNHHHHRPQTVLAEASLEKVSPVSRDRQFTAP